MEVFFFCLLKSDFASQLSGGHLVFFQHEEEFVLEEENQAQTKEDNCIDVTLNAKKISDGLGDGIRKQRENADRHPEDSPQSRLLPAGSGL